MAAKPVLAVCILFAAVAATTTRAATELPAVTVTATVTPAGDIVSRDRDQRSPEMHWPTSLFLKYSEIFAHNEIEINASCATVWSHLVQAQLWPQWCPFSKKVKISGGSKILQKNTRFSWVETDLPEDTLAIFDSASKTMFSEVVECVPESRLGWSSYGDLTIHGLLCVAYHNWLLTPISAKKCRVIFEEVATGVAARYARGAYPEIVHDYHQAWLERLKWVSERHR